MQKNAIKTSSILIVIIAVIAGYAVFQLKLSLNQNQALKIRLSEILEEKEQLQSQIKEADDNVNPLKEEIANLKKSLEDKEKQTVELKKQTTRAQVDAQNIRGELIKAKIRIKELDDELKLAKSTKSSLEKTGLKSSKHESLRKDSQEILSLRREVTQLSGALEAKDNEFAVLEARLKNVTEKYLTLDSANKFLEKQIEQLKAERLSLQGQLAKADEQLSRQDGLVSSLKNDTNSVNSLLIKKEIELDKSQKEVLALEEESSALEARSVNLERELAQTRERQGRVIADFGELTNLNAALQERLNELSLVLGQEEGDKEKARELKRKIEIRLEPVRPEKE